MGFALLIGFDSRRVGRFCSLCESERDVTLTAGRSRQTQHLHRRLLVKVSGKLGRSGCSAALPRKEPPSP
eukprot:3143325-Amphidinium_carterae.1